MACDATARLYDVDEDSVVFKRLRNTDKYDQGTFTFRARKGKLIDLDKLHESIWATRLSGGTRSGLVSLEVTTIGRVQTSGGKMMLRVSGSQAKFEIAPHPDAQHTAVFRNLKAVSSNQFVRLRGIIDDYRGRWPNVLKSKPKKPRCILVTGFELQDKPVAQTP